MRKKYTHKLLHITLDNFLKRMYCSPTDDHLDNTNDTAVKIDAKNNMLAVALPLMK